MKVPKDRFECHICKAKPNYITCESCWETTCRDCTEITWVVRNGEEWAHLLCKNCAGVEP